MKEQKFPGIHVYNVVAGFKSSRLKHSITPFRFELPDGTEHRIATIRQAHRERVGGSVHYHYVVKTREERYFHIVFDSEKLRWHLVQEFDAELLFNE